MFTHVEGLPKLGNIRTVDYKGMRHYCVAGERYPSITSVLGSFTKVQLENWKKREPNHEDITRTAGRRGTVIHYLVEQYIKNMPIREIEDISIVVEKNEKIEVSRQHQNTFKNMVKTLDRISNVRYQEVPLYSKSLRVAGRCDLIADFDDEPAIIDFKTSLKYKFEEYIQDYFIQKTAYSRMLQEMTGMKIPRIVTIIAVDGMSKPQVFKKCRDDYMMALETKVFDFYKTYEELC